MEKSDVFVHEPQKTKICDETEPSTASLNNEQMFSEIVCL